MLLARRPAPVRPGPTPRSTSTLILPLLLPWRTTTQCWCGSNTEYDANGEGLCNMLCAGAIDGEYCGGTFAMSVYENGGSVTTTVAPVDIVDSTDPSFLGCFSDPADSRVFLKAESSTSSAMTSEVSEAHQTVLVVSCASDHLCLRSCACALGLRISPSCSVACP